MGKTIYIQIDNNSLPEGCGEDVVVLDCRCINDFCSLVGDALVGDLKDESGKPFYRLINPVGKLLMDFKTVDEKAFNSIIEDWYDILGNLLHKGIQEDGIEIHFPQQYVDWLLYNKNDYYVETGKCLQSNDGKVYLDGNGVSEDIISVLHMKIRRFLNDKKDDIEYIVFSNERIGNASYVIKLLKTFFDSCVYLRLEQWKQVLKEEQQAYEKELRKKREEFQQTIKNESNYSSNHNESHGSDYNNDDGLEWILGAGNIMF